MKNGYISKLKENTYVIRFYNPITIKLDNIGYAKTYEEAEEIYRSYETEFYKDKKYLLPKSIHLGDYNGRKQFKLSFNTKMKNEKYKAIYIGTYPTLNEAIEAKKNLINIII